MYYCFSCTVYVLACWSVHVLRCFMAQILTCRGKTYLQPEHVLDMLSEICVWALVLIPDIPCNHKVLANHTDHYSSRAL